MEENDPEDPSQTSGSEDQRFWKALKSDLPPRPLNNAEQSGSIDISGDALQKLSTEELAARRDALRSMLVNNEARQKGVVNARPPTMAIGQAVLINSSEHFDKTGTIVDADFISSRALIDIHDTEEPQWVDFTHIASVPEDDSGNQP